MHKVFDIFSAFLHDGSVQLRVTLFSEESDSPNRDDNENKNLYLHPVAGATPLSRRERGWG